MSERIAIGISSCLLGQAVRYDGGHKLDNYITGTLGEYFDFLPVCPEVAIGMPVPRPPIRLVREADGIHVRGVRDPSLDVTTKLHAYGRKTARQLKGISGYIFKGGSPSCGVAQVKVCSPKGRLVGRAAGAFAEELMRAMPLLPVEEEGRLGDPGLRENFIMRVFVYHRWQQLLRSRLSAKKLIDFHAAHKYLVMAHNQAAYKRLGNLLADAGTQDLNTLSQRYIEELMGALRHPATRRGHANVLQHLLGYMKNQLDQEDKAEMLELIEQYREGQVPLVVPITLLKHHFRRHPNEYIERQVYLSPHPHELMLHNLI